MNEAKNRSQAAGGTATSRQQSAVPALIAAALTLTLSLGGAAVPAVAQAQAAGGAVVPAAAQAQAAGGAVVPAAAQAQAAGSARGSAQEQDARRAVETMAYVMPQVAWSQPAESSQVPQDIRIMQRIVQTALGEVAAPELPDVLQPDADAPDAPAVGYIGSGDSSNATVWTLSTRGNRVYSVGSRDTTGFYMPGYGYLFTVKWQVGRGGSNFVLSTDVARARVVELNALAEEARRSAAARQGAEARAADEAERTLQQEREQVEAREAAWNEWSAQYRSLLAEALREVVAQYGSTLQRATPDEAITFMADFGGGEEETVTVSARRGELEGASREANLAAVRMSMGESGVSATLRTELKIREEIIDSSLQHDPGTNEVWIAFGAENRYFGGSSSYQYVPGYGVIFRKSARLNMATQVIRDVNVAARQREGGVVVAPLRTRIEESTEEQRAAYAAHLEDLEQQTAEILAIYGPTLTQLGESDWVGVFYNVGSAAGLLEGGISNFLVQARMSDIRQAGNQADPATWLRDRLVTNERQD
jgi:hypothetical protein